MSISEPMRTNRPRPQMLPFDYPEDWADEFQDRCTLARRGNAAVAEEALVPSRPPANGIAAIGEEPGPKELWVLSTLGETALNSARTSCERSPRGDGRPAEAAARPAAGRFMPTNRPRKKISTLFADWISRRRARFWPNRKPRIVPRVAPLGGRLSPDFERGRKSRRSAIRPTRPRSRAIMPSPGGTVFSGRPAAARRLSKIPAPTTSARVPLDALWVNDRLVWEEDVALTAAAGPGHPMSRTRPGRPRLQPRFRVSDRRGVVSPSEHCLLGPVRLREGCQ